MQKFDIRDTDQRLRSFLNDNKTKREFLAAEMIGISDGFWNVVTQQTSGSRDGGADIRAEYEGRVCIIGVSFANDANDKADRTAMARKCVSDLENGLGKVPDAKAFAFVTNVNFTTHQRAELDAKVKSRGIERFEIFDRDRLMRLLNSPKGLLARYTYLDMRLTDEEQKSFFSVWGDDIRSSIYDSVHGLQNSLDRIQYMSDAILPIDNITFQIYWGEMNEIEQLDADLCIILHIHEWNNLQYEIISQTRPATVLNGRNYGGSSSIRSFGAFERQRLSDTWNDGSGISAHVVTPSAFSEVNPKITLRSLHGAQLSVRGNEFAAERIRGMRVLCGRYEIARYSLDTRACRTLSGRGLSVDHEENNALQVDYPVLLHTDCSQFNQIDMTPRKLIQRSPLEPEHWSFLSWKDGLSFRSP